MQSKPRGIRYYRRRGFDTERLLAKTLRDLRIWAFRIPASGMYESRRNMSLPDVIAFLPDGRVAGFQLKATSKARYTVSPKELKPLVAFVEDGRYFERETVGFAVVRFVGRGRSLWAGCRVEKAESVKFTLNDAYSLQSLLYRLGVIR